MDDFKNYEKLISKLGYNLEIDEDNIKMFLELIELNFFVFDFMKPCHDVVEDKNLLITRMSFSALIERRLVNDFCIRLSDEEYVITVSDHKLNKSVVFRNGKSKKLIDNDIITRYKLVQNDFGNIKLQKLEHVYNYGSDIDSVAVIFQDPTKIIDDYIEITVIDQYFFSPGNVLCKCLDILTQLQT